MNQNRPVLKIYSLSHPLLSTEWLSILGDKYRYALPFDIVETDYIDEASVIAWDGTIPLKQRRLLNQIESYFKNGKILLMMGESQTLYKDHPYIKLYKDKEAKIVQLTGWSVLPEEMLAALQTCYQKLQNV